MQPRDYQHRAIDAVLTAFKTHRSALIVLPTGAGKTIVFSHIAQAMLDKGRAMMLAHREELIHQGAQKMHAVTGIRPDIEMADSYANEHGYLALPSPIVVSSIQTQNAGRDKKRMERFDPKQFSLVILDEAHHAAADSYRKILAHYEKNPACRILGVTATPDRSDELALGEIFQTCAFKYEITDAIKDGWLVPIRQRFIVCHGLDFSGVKTTAGDLNAGDLAKELERERSMHEMVSPCIEIIGTRKTLFFAVSVLQAERTAEIFNRHRPDMARCVFGHTPKDARRKILSDFREGAFQVLVNVGIATEGYDEPSIEVIAIGRPTKSRALYSQMIGRGTRSLTGTLDGIDIDLERRQAIAQSAKPCVEVLDFVGQAGRHKLVTMMDVLGGKELPEIGERAKRIIEKSSGGMDVQQAIDEAKVEEERIRAHAEAKRRAAIKARAEYTARDVDPFNKKDQWENKATPWYWKIKPATEKQANLLKRYGYDTGDMTMKDASGLIDAIAKNGWKRPT